MLVTVAVKKGLASEKRIIEVGKKFAARNIVINKASDVVKITVSNAFLRELAKELDLPESVGEKTTVEQISKTETVTPHVQLNPLYDYQYATGLHIRDMLEDNGKKRSLISIPTGAGKTRLVVETLIEWLNDGKPGAEKQKNSKFILWIAQSNELCEQAFSTFRSVFEDRGKQGTILRLHRFWGKGQSLPFISMTELLEEKGVIVANIQSLYNVAESDPQQLQLLSKIT